MLRISFERAPAPTGYGTGKAGEPRWDESAVFTVTAADIPAGEEKVRDLSEPAPKGERWALRVLTAKEDQDDSD